MPVVSKVPYVRVFGDKVPPGEPRDAVIARVIDGLRTLGEHAKGSGVTVIIESHGDFTDGASLRKILDGAAMPNVALLWDAHHTCVMSKEDPAATYKLVGSYVRHTHLKDSRPDGDGIKYVLPGSGTVPIRETVNVLAKAGYRGYYGFEWEKVWHPEIEEPEVAFPQYAQLMRQMLTRRRGNAKQGLITGRGRAATTPACYDASAFFYRPQRSIEVNRRSTWPTTVRTRTASRDVTSQRGSAQRLPAWR